VNTLSLPTAPHIKSAMDIPIKLHSTEHWKTIGPTGIRVWHIVAELVQMNMVPIPDNPFALDVGLWDGLSAVQRSLMAAGMAAFYREIFARVEEPSFELLRLQSAEDWNKLVQRDLETCLRVHFQSVEQSGQVALGS
jgi:hypothetical protein